MGQSIGIPHIPQLNSYGTVKARACADVRKQRETTMEEEDTSPTMSIESVFMSCAIDANKGQDVAVLDLLGAFLHADCDDHIIMQVQGWLAELMSLLLHKSTTNM